MTYRNQYFNKKEELTTPQENTDEFPEFLEKYTPALINDLKNEKTPG